MFIHMYHMKIEEITRKTQNQKENNSPSISPQRVKNITFAKKFITVPVSVKEDGQLSIYNVQVDTRMQFCMDLKLSKRNVQPLTIKRWIWAPIAIVQHMWPKPFWKRIGISWVTYFLNLEMFNICDNYLPKCWVDLCSNSRVIINFFFF